MDKDRVIETVKEWIQVDNEIKELQKQVREKREEKKMLSTILIDVMRNNEIDCFDVNDGALVYSKRKVKSGLTKKHILESLTNLFKEDTEKINFIAEQIFESRKELDKEVIHRRIKK